MSPWQNEIKQLQDELKQLQIKLQHPHLVKSAEGDYDIKGKIIELQNKIIGIYIAQTDKIVGQGNK